MIIDEWVDDWGRSEERGCPGSVFQHPHTGPCDEVRPGRTINQDRHNPLALTLFELDQEWFGLNGQYTFLSFHCLDPRYHQDHPSKNGTIGQMAFRFEQIPDAKTERAIWDRLPGGYCEPWPVVLACP